MKRRPTRNPTGRGKQARLLQLYRKLAAFSGVTGGYDGRECQDARAELETMGEADHWQAQWKHHYKRLTEDTDK